MTFRWVSHADAVERYREEQRQLQMLEDRARSLFLAVNLPHASAGNPPEQTAA